MLRITALALLTAGFCAPCKGQTENRPPELSFLSAFDQFRNRYPYKSWDKVTFHNGDKFGRHWNMLADVPGPKIGDDDGVLSKVKPLALQAGWTIVWDDTHRSGVVEFHYQKNGVEAWANAFADFGGSPARVHWDMIEIAPPPISVTLVEPSATPEKMPTGTKGDIPFLIPLPKSTEVGGQDSNAPMSLKWKNSQSDEIVANGSISRYYKYPELSDLLFGTVYHDALIKAGWDVDQPEPDKRIFAHYSKKGRNLWAYMNLGGDGYVIQVGKEGAPNQLKQSLAADCHVALYGVLFDFNKSTLQPASDGPLQQVAALMAANPTLKIEVQGHTDNVGGDTYNQTLSEARAHSVMAWLTAHGVAASRMTVKGYGKTMPVADNSTDDGRAKNRRVEIADPNCKRH
jgi:outer membrane protein OmpA-like peptidoglycan-associated protein